MSHLFSYMVLPTAHSLAALSSLSRVSLSSPFLTCDLVMFTKSLHYTDFISEMGFYWSTCLFIVAVSPHPRHAFFTHLIIWPTDHYSSQTFTGLLRMFGHQGHMILLQLSLEDFLPSPILLSFTNTLRVQKVSYSKPLEAQSPWKPPTSICVTGVHLKGQKPK